MHKTREVIETPGQVGNKEGEGLRWSHVPPQFDIVDHSCLVIFVSACFSKNVLVQVIFFIYLRFQSQFLVVICQDRDLRSYTAACEGN